MNQNNDRRAAVFHPRDNVATTLVLLHAGDTAGLPGGERVVLTQEIPRNHKFATRPILQGENVYKYGEVIGVALSDIAPGMHVHICNIASARGHQNAEGESVCLADTYGKTGR